MAKSSSRFVVRLHEPGGERRRSDLARLGRTESVPQGPEDMPGLLVVHIDGDEHAGWRNIASVLGAADFAAPVLADADGGVRFPTGRIVVRFHESPDEATLTSFAKTSGLRSPVRNEYVESQVQFDLASPRETFLPDLLTSLQASPAVSRVWPESLSTYRKADPS